MKRRYVLGALIGLFGCGGREKERADAKGAPPAVDTSAEKEIAYSIELEQGGELLHVGDDWQFHSGDRFRLLFRPEFDAYVYVVNRGPAQSAYQMLFPNPRIALQNPIPAGKEVRVPDSDTAWLHMDNQPGNENLILIAATTPLTELDGMGPNVDRDDFEARLANVERKRRPSSSRRFEDKNWVKLFAARGKEDLAIVLRLPLLHM